jgi:hypothetical protein
MNDDLQNKRRQNNRLQDGQVQNGLRQKDDLEFDALIKKMAAEHQPELPSPGLIWWRAQIVGKQAEKERIERPFRIMHLLAGAVCLVVFAGLWISQAASVRDELGRLLPFAPLLLVAGAVGLGLLLLMWWTTSEA